MTEVLKAGVAGAGVFGGYHANKYAEAEAANLVAIFDMDQGRADERAAEHGATGYSDYAAFLDAIDVLTIATPATTHAELASKAIAAGKHVLVEKPIALNLEDADALIAAADANNVVIQVGHQERYVASGFGLMDRGVPQAVRSRRMNRYSPRAGDVSVVMDLMIHDLDLLAQLTGQSDGKILGLETRKEKGVHADYVDVTLDVGGVEAQLIASRLEEDPTRDLKMTYADGEVVLNFLKREVSNTTSTPVAAEFGAEDLPLSLKDPLAFGTQSFLASVSAGSTPVVTGQAGRRALALALMIEEAVNG